MTTTVRVIGVDPGPTPGLVRLDFAPDPFRLTGFQVVQCNAQALHGVYALLHGDNPMNANTFVQVERFVVGRASMRGGAAGALTRDQIGALERYSADWMAVSWRQRPAGNVKPWATDERLAATPLLEATKGMQHARDAARHALYCAVHDARMPDPLSKTARYR